ncbi:uncharacterized protein K444DRAFT_514985, partial [Hyaloscypha bicolor E]
FKGIRLILSGAVSINTIKFYIYRNIKRILSNINNSYKTTWVYLIATITIGIIISTTINPI